MYRTLLQASFFCATRPYLPNNDNHLWVLAGCVDKQQWMENKRPVRAMFNRETVDGHRLLFRKRVLEDWQRLLNKRKELHERGKKGGFASASVRAQHKLSASSPEVDIRSTKTEVEKEVEVEIQEESEVSSEQELSLEQGGHADDGNTGVSEQSIKPSSASRTTEVNQESIPPNSRQSREPLSPEAQKVVQEIAYLSDGRVIPDYKQSLVIAGWLDTATADEITDAFDDFYMAIGTDERGDKNEFEIRHAARNFCEKGQYLIEVDRRNERERRESKEWDQEVARKTAESAQKPETAEENAIGEHSTQDQ
jgi:hypothetical protein